MADFPSCLLLLGPDRGLQNAEVHKIEEGLRKKFGQGLERTKLYADQDPVDQILDGMRNSSLFSDYRLVTIHGAECFTAVEMKQIKEYWNHPSDSVTAVFCSSEYSEVKAKFSFAKAQEIRSFWELDEGKKLAWIRNYIATAHGSIDGDALERLALLVESDTQALQQTCELLLCIRPDKHISMEDVDSWVFHSKEENAYTLFEAMAEKHAESALGILGKLKAAQDLDSSQVLGTLLSQFRTLHGFARTYGRGPLTYDSFKNHNVRNPKAQKAFNTGLSRWKIPEIEAALAKLGAFELAVRAEKTYAQVLQLELLVYQILLSPRADTHMGEPEASLFGRR